MSFYRRRMHASVRLLHPSNRSLPDDSDSPTAANAPYHDMIALDRRVAGANAAEISGQPQRFGWIDSLRGCAILAVILVHTEQWTNASWPGLKLICLNGARGVQLFFLASAITLCLSLDVRSRSERHPLRNFLIRRSFRIAPLFYFGIALFLSIQGMGGRYWAPDGLHFFHIILTLTFLHCWHPESINSVVPGGWSIGAEMFFYLLLPWLHRFLKNVAVAIGLIVVCLILQWCALRWLAPVLCPPYSAERVYLSASFGHLWPFAQLPAFALGLVAYVIMRDHSHLLRPSLGYCLIAIALIFALLCLRVETLWGVLQPQVLFAGIFLLFTLGLYATRSRLIVNAPVIFLGKISFSLYMLHFGVLHFFKTWQPTGLALAQPWALPAAYALVLTVSSLAAWATHRLIEQKGIQVGRFLTAYLERPAAHLATACKS